MLKSVLNCITCEGNRKFGNHSTETNRKLNGDLVQTCKYHDNTICLINWTIKVVYLDNCGWNTSSTNRVLNDYKRYFQENHPTFTIIDSREQKTFKKMN